MTFLYGKPFYIMQPDTGRRVPVVWVHERPGVPETPQSPAVGPARACPGPVLVARWEIAGPMQRMHKYSAIPKDKQVWDDIIRPHCQLLEVLDKTENILYSISVRRFDELKWLLTTKAGPQWAVDRQHWMQKAYSDALNAAGS